MAATYDPTLPSDKDWVRCLTGDRNMRKPILMDEEIAGILGAEHNKYLAAARAGEIILTRGKGVVSKAVEGLSVSFESSPESAYTKHLQRLRERGAELTLQESGSSVLRML